MGRGRGPGAEAEAAWLLHGGRWVKAQTELHCVVMACSPRSLNTPERSAGVMSTSL